MVNDLNNDLADKSKGGVRTAIKMPCHLLCVVALE